MYRDIYLITDCNCPLLQHESSFFDDIRIDLCLVCISDIFEDLVSPTVAATHFLSRACAKRKGTLDPVMAVCIQILDTPQEQRQPSQKDGALHVIGQVAETLLTVRMFKLFVFTTKPPICSSEYSRPHPRLCPAIIGHTPDSALTPTVFIPILSEKEVFNSA